MRSKKDRQGRLEFKPSTLKITNNHYARYDAISKILDQTPAILDLVHQDLAKALGQLARASRREGRPCQYTSDMLLRIVVCQSVEGVSLREIVVRIDDSYFFRQFVKIGDDSMMDYTVLCRLRNKITPKTWKKINLTRLRLRPTRHEAGCGRCRQGGDGSGPGRAMRTFVLIR